MIRELAMDALRLSHELLARVLANSQTTSSEATAPTPIPKTESINPSFPRCTRTNTVFPTTRPAAPPSAPTTSMVTRATTVRMDGDCTQSTVTEASSAPR